MASLYVLPCARHILLILSVHMLILDVVLMLPYYERKSAAISAVQHLLNMRAEQMHNSFSGFWRILNELLMDNRTHAWLGSLYSWIKRKAYSLVHNGWSSLEKSDSYGRVCATCRSVYAGSCYSDGPAGRGCQRMQAGVMEPAVSLMGWLHRLWSLCCVPHADLLSDLPWHQCGSSAVYLTHYLAVTWPRIDGDH